MKNVNSRSTYTLRKLSIGLVSVALAGALFVASQDQAKAAVSDSFEANHPEVHAQAPETAHNQAVAAEMNNLVNELREKNNLQPLTTNQQLEDAARLSAYDDAASGSLSHANDYNRLADVGYLSHQQANEYEATNIPTLSYGQQMAQANLHSGGSTESTSISPRQQAEDVINGWTADIKLPSRGHRTQMLSSHWNQVGSAQVQSQSGGRNNANHVQYYGTDALSGYNRPQANDPFIPLDSYPDYLNRMVDHYTRWGDTAALADIDYLKDEYRRNMAHFNLPIGGTSTTPTPQEPVIRTAEENRTEVIPYETVRQANPDLAQGDERVRTPGVNGVLTITEEVTYRDGVETGRRIISREITIAPVNEVIEYGTQIPTPEPSDTPPSSSEGQAGTGTVGEQADQETTPPSSEQTPADTGQTEPQAGDQGTSKGEPEDPSVPSPTDTGTGQGPEVGHTQTGQSESEPAAGQEALTAVINKIDNLDQVPAILEGKDFDLYDIYLLDGEGNKVQPNQDVEITLALDNDKTVTQVLHLGQDLTDGQVDVLAFSQNANIVVFKTDHFSYFAIVYGQEAPAAGKVQVVDLSATETGEKESAAAGKDSASKADSTDSATASAETAESSSPALPSTGMGSMAAALGLSIILGGLGLVTKKKD